MSPNGSSVVVVGLGARTAVGMTAVATAAAVRAGIPGLMDHPFVVDMAGRPMVVAAAPYLSMDVTGAERLAELAAPAVGEAISEFAGATGGRHALPVFLGLPRMRGDDGREYGLVVQSRVRNAVAAHCRVSAIATFETGHAAGAMAVQAAWEAVRSGQSPVALAGAVDSYCDPETLEWLEAHDQVHSAGEQNNPYGFIPGEAAGFVLLATSVLAEQRRLPVAVELLAAATTREAKLIKTDAVCTGEGLSALFRILAEARPGVHVESPVQRHERRTLPVGGVRLCHHPGWRAFQRSVGVHDAGGLLGRRWRRVGAVVPGAGRRGDEKELRRRPGACRFHEFGVWRTLRVHRSTSICLRWAAMLTVKLNGTKLGLVHKGSSHMAKWYPAPDVCKTPSPGGPVPIPYPVIISKSSDLKNGTTTVKADGGQMIAVKGCEYASCNGDEAGTAGGVVSSTNMKEAKFILFSFDVKLDGKNACRLGDKMTMNHQNTICMAGTDPTECEPEILKLSAPDCNEKKKGGTDSVGPLSKRRVLQDGRGVQQGS